MLLERSFPRIVAYFAKGQLHEQATKKWCVAMPSKMCKGDQCQGFHYFHRKYNWRYWILFRRRGKCSYLG
jgi:hypothetical protein